MTNCSPSFNGGLSPEYIVLAKKVERLSWIEEHGSSELRRKALQGFRHYWDYLKERGKMEMPAGFELESGAYLVLPDHEFKPSQGAIAAAGEIVDKCPDWVTDLVMVISTKEGEGVCEAVRVKPTWSEVSFLKLV